MAKLILDVSGKGGLAQNYFGDSDQLASSPQRRYLAKPGEMVEGIFNPFLRNGYLSAGQAVLTAQTYTGGTLDAIPGSAIYDAVNDDYYFAERGRQLWKGDTFDDVLLSMVMDFGATGTPVIHDLEIYQVNGSKKLFVVYEKNDNMYIGISSLPYDTGTDNPDWLTTPTVSGGFTNATTSPYNFMRVADNGFAYVFQDNVIHKIDGTSTGGTNGTITPNIVVFPPHFRLTDAIDYRGNIFAVLHQTTVDITTIAASPSNYSNQCGVYIWDRLSTQVKMRDFIPVSGVRCIKTIYISPTGKIRLMCIGANNLGQIREFNGNSFEVIKELGLGSMPQYVDSLTQAGQLTVWTGTDGIIYAHGQTGIGEPEILTQLGYVKAPVTSSSKAINVTAGAILYGGSNTFSSTTGYRVDRQGFTIAYNDGALKISRFYPFDKGSINSVSQTSLQGDVYTPVVQLPFMSTIEDLNIYCMTGTTSGSTTAATMKIYFNGSSTAWASKIITRDDIVKGYKNIQINKSFINSIQIEIEFATGTVMSDSTDFHPSYVEVNYQPTKTLK